ncbi:hypothetical protein O6H91_23G032100 [Diphasiastrum complanatum]|uniref:Uncharacterized protein n=1 Tax=Diphasiastrum complanatum TaxID=34168 RepID=A0ACC2A9N1_DIPCM|nr:hypothetical protein O6H91_23G032100 [Diphasiastrum complanatum]
MLSFEFLLTKHSYRILVRSNTMPCELFSDVIDVSLRDDEKRLSRSTTEKWQSYKSADNGKMYKIAAEKILERKKKKLRTFVTLQNHDMLEFDPTGNILAGNFSCSTTVKENEAAGNEIIQNHRAISPLQIVMLIVGTRGDVQPFIAIGKHLQEFGHRVRLATHANFRQFVVDAGLEYYPLGGDPKVLAGYMVRNKGLLPTAPSEISISWVQVKAILDSLLPACTESDGEHGAPFRAEAIIANPPAYGQVHVAEALKVPIHIFFTMPWTPTSEFPHPLSWMWNPAGYRLSYQMVDLLMWLGSRGLINEFRRKKLKLSPVTYLGGGSSLSRYSTLPTGYIWSSHLVPKPKDWGPLVDVVGFCFLDLASNFKAPIALTNWLQSGTSPIYFGFGSLPLEDPQGMTEIIVEALQQTHQRGIIDKGWGGMGTSALPSNFVYLIENCPHDWLFPQCVAVVHHGGAGTTAAGLRAACPTTIIPFFGDQLFWSERVHSKGVGPAPIPIGHLSVERLVAAIQFMLEPEVKRRAHEMAQCIEQENGVSGAVNSFHKHFPKTSQLRVLPSSPTPFNFFLGLLKRMCCY